MAISNLKISSDNGKHIDNPLVATAGRAKNSVLKGAKGIARKINDTIVDSLNNPVSSAANDRAAAQFKKELSGERPTISNRINRVIK